MSAPRFHLLGSFEVLDGDGTPVPVGGPLPRALLTVLLLAENRLVTAESLLDQLWDGEPPEGAQATLHSTVSRLRKVLEPGRPSRSGWQVLRSDGGGYRLSVPRDAVDVARFSDLADAGRRALDGDDPAGAVAHLQAAEALWRGPALVEFADRAFARAAAAGLDERRLAVTEDRFDAELRLGRHTAVLGNLGRFAEAEPLRERVQQLLALALYRSGRQADALAALERTRTQLRDELGLDPGAPLRDLEAAILRQDPTLDLAAVPRPAVRVPEAPAARIPLPRAPLVGRDVENGRLRALLHEVVGGTSRFALVEGEPGIGKTRMLEEAAANATALGARVVWGRCSEAERAPAFWPWLEVLRGLGVTEGGRRVELSDLVGADDPAGDPTTRRFGLFESVADHLRAAAGAAPLVVLFEDLHWSDLPSAELLAHLADRLHDVPVAVVASLRELELGRDDAVSAAIAAINRRSGTQRLHLRGLSPAAAPALVREVVDVDVRADVAVALHRRTDGNPFGLAELSRLLAAESGLDDPAAVERAQVPAGVRDVVRRRLTALPQPTRTMLETFAVIGREADLAVLLHAADADADTCLEALETALTSRVLVPVPEVPGRHRFAHALTREAALAEMNALRATRLHARVADAVVAVVGDTDETAEIIANHLWSAAALVGPTRAAEALERAADVALRRLAYENAEDLLQRALTVRRSIAPDRAAAEAELRTTIGLVRLRRALRGYSRAIEAVTLDRPKELALAAGRPDLYQGLLLIEWGATGTGGDVATCVQLGAQMREFGRSVDSRVVRYLGEYAWGVSLWHVGRMPEAARTMHDVESELGELSDSERAGLAALDALSLFTSFAIHIYVMAGTVTDADPLWHELEASLSDPYDKLVVAHFGGLTAACSHDPAGARYWSERGLVIEEKGGFAFFGAACEIYLGWCRALEGEPEAGLAQLQAGLRRFSSTGTRTGLALMFGMLVEAMLAAGRAPDEASEVLEDAARNSIPTDELWALPYLDIARARIARARGDVGSARALCQRAVQGGRDLSVVPVVRVAETLLAEMAARPVGP